MATNIILASDLTPHYRPHRKTGVVKLDKNMPADKCGKLSQGILKTSSQRKC